MNTPQRADRAHEEPLRITLEGPPALITRILRGIDSALSGEARGAPEKLYLSRAEAAELLGIHEDRISALVRAGKLRNHGAGRILQISRQDLLGLVE